MTPMYRRISPLIALSLIVACNGDDAASSDSNTDATVTVTASATATTTDGTSSGTATDSDSTTTEGGSESNSESGVSATDTEGTTTDTTTDSGSSETETTTGGPGCGDSIVQEDLGEVCDDGINDGSYGSCTEDCQGFGPFCGDGILDDGFELCDDGNDIDDDACGNDCGASQCAEIMVVLEPLPPNIMMVVDKSGSMVSNSWDHDEDPNTPPITRWNSLHGVVDNILTNFQDKLSLGLSLFPALNATSNYNQTACIVGANPEVPVAINNKDAILAVLPGPGANDSTIKGGTPASSGMITALDHLKSLDPKFPRAVLLVTDGAANCTPNAGSNFERFETYDQVLHDVVKGAWDDEQIPTYVVGIDISKQLTGNQSDGEPNGIVPYDKLNELAIDGGKPQDGVDKFYATQSQIELQAALDQIAQDALSCVVSLDEPPIFPQNTKVKIGNMLVPKVEDCGSEDGWVYTDEEYTGIELCGSWCDSLKETGQLNVEYFCKPG